MEYKRLLVPFTGTKADEEALKLALSLGKRSKGKVFIIYVILVKRSLPLDADVEPIRKKGEEILEMAEKIAEEEDFEVETELLQAREVGPAIVEEAIDRNVDIIIMGLEYKEKFGKFSLSETATYILKNAPCSVFLCREPIGRQGG